MFSYHVTLQLPDTLDLGQTADARAETVSDILTTNLQGVEGAKVEQVREQPVRLPVVVEMDYRVLAAAEAAAEQMGVSFGEAVELAVGKMYEA